MFYFFVYVCVCLYVYCIQRVVFDGKLDIVSSFEKSKLKISSDFRNNRKRKNKLKNCGHLVIDVA